MKLTPDEERRRVEEVVAKFNELGINTVKELWQAIVSEAARAETEVIVLRAPRKERSRRAVNVFGKTVDYVLKHASCRVMVAALPAASC